jgi:hypothetical protein
MTLRHLLGVVPAVLLVLGGAIDLMASEPAIMTGDECCVAVQGKCVPCEGMASTTPTALFTSSAAAAHTVSGTAASTACGGPCVPMTPAECQASGCNPTSCAGGTCTPKTPAECQASGCNPTSCAGGPCTPVSSCGSGSGCASAATSSPVGIRDARTGEVTFVTMPLAGFKAMLATHEKPPVGGDI